MLESFGARLRQRREEQGVDLVAIAAQTKIKLSLLEGLERDDVSHWPSGIYRRAYIRTYAHAIGLSPDVVVREFLEIYPDPVELAAAAAIAAAVESARVNTAPPTRLRNIVGSALGSLSRLRRSPGLEDSSARDDARVEVPAAAELEVDSQSLPDPVGADAPTELVIAGRPVNVPGSPEPADTLVSAPASYDLDLLAVANLCTEFGRVADAEEVPPLLQESARILDATGLIVWIWDASAEGLRPALAEGYSPKVLASLPTVSRGADNATAAAFRSAQRCAVEANEQAAGALVVPLLTPAGCVGVLAIELQHGRQQTEPLLAVATILAALLAQLVGVAQAPEVQPLEETAESPGEDFGAPVLQTTVRR